MTRVVRGVGWTLVVAGAVVLLYVVYLLWFTGLSTSQAQDELGEDFASNLPGAVGDEQAVDPGGGADEGAGPGDDVPGDAAAGDDGMGGTAEAYAAMWFERDGRRVVSDRILYVVDDVSLDDLRSGPGHYPDSAEPGGSGNLAIAGHRTTYGAPFSGLDQLRDGDRIHVVDRAGDAWVYAYREQRVVSPADTWVVDEPDPIDLGAPTLTLTTCHPRFSAAQRLVAFGELVDGPGVSA